MFYVPYKKKESNNMCQEKRCPIFLFSCENKKIHLRLVGAFFYLISRFDIIDKGVFDMVIDKFIKGVFKFWTGSIQLKIRTLFEEDFVKDIWQNSCSWLMCDTSYLSPNAAITKRTKSRKRRITMKSQNAENRFAIRLPGHPAFGILEALKKNFSVMYVLSVLSRKSTTRGMFHCKCEFCTDNWS